VDVNGDKLVTVADLKQIVDFLRAQQPNGGSAEAEAEGEGEPVEAAPTLTAAPTRSAAPSVWGGADLSSPTASEAVRTEEDKPTAAGKMGDALVLANSSFRTYEFESALSDIAGDVSGVWDQDNSDELDDYFPYSDVIARQEP
jgi:hypothetical protein